MKAFVGVLFVVLLLLHSSVSSSRSSSSSSEDSSSSSEDSSSSSEDSSSSSSSSSSEEDSRDESHKSGDKKVVCYFTNWSFYRSGAGEYLPKNIDPKLCTHIAYAFATLEPNNLTIAVFDTWADLDNKHYEQVAAFQKKGVKVSISLGGWTDSTDKYGPLLTDENNRRNFISNATKFIKKYKFDGLDLDLEYPACWQTVCNPEWANQKEGFAQLVKELRKAFKPHGWLLSAAVSANSAIVDKAYDVPTLSKNLDWIGLLTYDYHGSFDGKTGQIAPLYSSDTFSVNFTVNYWINAGASPNKLVLGIPCYGQSFTLADPNNHGYNATSIGPGAPGNFTQAAGTLAYYEICQETKSNSSWTVVRDNRIGPYATSGNQWVSFDDVENVRIKSEFARKLNLGGGMIWALDLDDFTGSCGCGKYPLLTTLNQGLRGLGGKKLKNCT